MPPVRKPIATDLDYGRRPEMEGGKNTPDAKGWLKGGGVPGSFRELVSRESEASLSRRKLLQHSEFKKPYLTDDFEEMEHFASPQVGDPSIGTDLTPDEYPADLKEESTCWDVCHKGIASGWVEQDTATTCFIYVSHYAAWGVEIVGNKVIIDGGSSVDVEFEYISGTQKVYKSLISHTINSSITWTVFQKQFEACPNVSEEVANSCKKVHTRAANCSGDPNCPIGFDWNDALSAETIGQSDTASVYVSGGAGPYFWSVSGTDVWLTNAETAGVSNTLNTGANACGSMKVTVRDSQTAVPPCTTEGYVRCTAGEWERQGGDCDGYSGFDSGGPKDFTLTDGDTKIDETIENNLLDGGCDNPGTPSTHGIGAACLPQTCADVSLDTCISHGFCDDIPFPACGNTTCNTYIIFAVSRDRYKWVCS